MLSWEGCFIRIFGYVCVYVFTLSNGIPSVYCDPYLQFWSECWFIFHNC